MEQARLTLQTPERRRKVRIRPNLSALREQNKQEVIDCDTHHFQCKSVVTDDKGLLHRFRTKTQKYKLGIAVTKCVGAAQRTFPKQYQPTNV